MNHLLQGLLNSDSCDLKVKRGSSIIRVKIKNGKMVNASITYPLPCGCNEPKRTIPVSQENVNALLLVLQ